MSVLRMCVFSKFLCFKIFLFSVSPLASSPDELVSTEVEDDMNLSDASTVVEEDQHDLENRVFWKILCQEIWRSAAYKIEEYKIKKVIFIIKRGEYRYVDAMKFLRFLQYEYSLEKEQFQIKLKSPLRESIFEDLHEREMLFFLKERYENSKNLQLN